MASASRPTRSKRRVDHPDRDNPLGALVRLRRKSEGLTQRALAELAGVAPKVVWELEHGKPTMRMDVVERVLRVFGKTLGAVDLPRADLEVDD